jgi:predicted RNase H-like nuclease (RuvC/YqgF family)
MRKEELQSEIAKLQAANEKIRESLEIVEKEIEIGTEQGAYIEGSLMAKANLESALQKNIQRIQELEAKLAALEGQEDGENQDQE